LLTIILKNKVVARFFFKNDSKQFGNSRVNKLLIHDKDIWIGTDNYLTYCNTRNKTTASVKQPLYSGISGKNSFRRFGAVKDLSWYNNKILVCLGAYVLVQDNARRTRDFKVICKMSRRYYCVHADSKGGVWYGASDGLYCINDDGEVNHASESVFLSNNIYDIEETADSVLVLASYGYGVLFYKDGKVLQHLTEADGLSSNLCRKVFVHKNQIYVASPGGATIIIYNNGHVSEIKKVTTADGLLTNSVNDVYADDSEVCFATQDGLTVLDTRKPEATVSAPPVYITSINCRDQQLSPDSNYTFSHGQNSIGFTFTGLSYRSPDNVLYQYRLTEEQEWTEAKNTSLDFPSLSPGKYHFQLRAKVLNGPWSQTRSFYFTINPPFWRTSWFAVMCAIAFIMLVILVARYQVRAAKRKHEEELRIKDQVTQLEQQALQAMMNPHFIFNVMNSTMRNMKLICTCPILQGLSV